MSRDTTYIKAIRHVLTESDRPLTAYEIYMVLKDGKYLDFDFGNAQTPWTAVRARISEDIARNQSGSSFIRTSRGAYWLREKFYEGRGGFFLAIEGLDGSGKTEIAHRLSRILEKTHRGSVLLTFEPHDPSTSGYFIRQLLTGNSSVSRKVQAVTFAANRADHYEKLIRPFLSGSINRICICDRYYLSSLVYQSSDEIKFEDIMALNFAAEQPDLTIFLDASAATSLRRMKTRKEDREIFEFRLSESREKYHRAAEFLRTQYGETIISVNADGSLEEVLNKIGDYWLISPSI